MEVRLDYTPHEKQKEIHGACNNPLFKFITVVSGRQAGKTKAAQMQVIKWALQKKCKIWVVSPTYSQSVKFSKDISKPLSKAGLLVRDNKSQGEILIEFVNSSTIEFKSSLSKNSLRGSTLDFLVLDEGAFIGQDVVDEVLIPMLITKPNSKMLIVTTPKGKRNWVFKYFNLGLNKSEEYNKYYSIHFTSKDNPLSDDFIIEDAKKNLPDYIFKQEYLGEFIENGTELFANHESIFILNEYAKPSNINYAGIDLGRMDDYTVLTILNSSGQLVYQYRDNKKSWNLIVENIVAALKKYNCQAICELNGIGDPLFEMIKNKYANVEGFTTSNSSKQNIIEDLMVDFQNVNIQLSTEKLNKELRDEILNLEFDYNIKTRKVSYHAPQGLHDDCVMSLCFANYARKNKRNYGKYNMI